MCHVTCKSINDIHCLYEPKLHYTRVLSCDLLLARRKVVGSACSMEMAASNEVKGEEGKGQKPGDSYKINEQDISVSTKW